MDPQYSGVCTRTIQHGGFSVKTLTLHGPSELTEDGRHVSSLGLDMAHGCGAVYYRQQAVDHVFTSPLLVTAETAAAMIVENPSFAKACRHPAFEGLGTEDALTLLHNELFDELIAGGASVMEALEVSHDRDVQHVFMDEAMLAIHEMFACMGEDQLAVGVFDPHFIVMAAQACGLRDLHSLEVLEGIVFEFRGENNIVAKRQVIS